MMATFDVNDGGGDEAQPDGDWGISMTRTDDDKAGWTRKSTIDKTGRQLPRPTNTRNLSLGGGFLNSKAFLTPSDDRRRKHSMIT